jgi:hypothetical protein
MNTSSNNPAPQAPDPLAVALSKLEPAPHGFEWNTLMFAAGRASKERALVFWRVVACVCALAACGFAFVYFTRPANERVDYVERPVTIVPAPAVPQPQPLPLPIPEPGPTPGVLPKPEPTPEPPVSPSMQEPSGWSFESPAEQGAATHWLNKRNEVLTVGLSILPDTSRKVQPPR